LIPLKNPGTNESFIPAVRTGAGDRGTRPVTPESPDFQGKAVVRQAVSAGGVVLRHTSSGLQVVLCFRESEGLWALPKGTPEPNETREETARREVREETGLEVESGPSVAETRYSFVRDGYLYEKVVYFYLMSAIGGDTRLHDKEFDLVEWVPVDQAIEQLTFKNESRIVEKALPMAEEQRHGQTPE